MTRPCHACGAPAGDLAALCAACSRSTRAAVGAPAAGEVRYVAHPDEVERVRVIRLGTDRHHKRRMLDPVTVRACSEACADPRCADDHEYAVPARELYSDPLAAAVRSAELAREVAP